MKKLTHTILAATLCLLPLCTEYEDANPSDRDYRGDYALAPRWGSRRGAAAHGGRALR